MLHLYYRMSEFNLNKRLGAFPSPWDFRHYRVERATLLQVEQLPTEYIELLDYSPEGCGNLHDDQGDIGSCVGWDGSIVMETINRLEDKIYIDLSAWWAYHRSRYYAGVPDWEEGSTNIGLMKALNKEGIVPEADCPTPKINESFSCDIEKGLKVAKNWVIDQYWNVNNNPNDIKATIYGLTHEFPYKMSDGSQGKGPLVSAFPVYSSFEESYNNGIVPIPQIGDKLLGGHSSPIFGWKIIDDKKYYINYGSWGDQVADDGVFYIPEDYPFFPNDWFLLHNGPPTNIPDPTPSPCNIGKTWAKFNDFLPWILRREGRFYYLNRR